MTPSSMVVSDDLLRQLTELQLCSSMDFWRARTCVRRLARDLPVFDSLWIDALVKLKRLTPYQARILDSGSAEDLRLGPYVIEDKLGHGPHGTTFLARRPGRREHMVLKRLEVSSMFVRDCRNRLQKLQEQTDGWSHGNLIVPRLLNSEIDQLLLVSRWIPGLTLTELLVRRGRFPSSVVVDIARQLASGLAFLHGRGLAHGDIRLSNVRLTTSGAAILVDGGVRPVVCPELTVHETLALEAYDGAAPELIGTGAAPNAASEMYALGCMLWQLLTGRAPYPMADPLMKLAAHQTQRVADVRIWAPDTNAGVAETLVAMTSPIANDRPRSFEELQYRWGRPGMASRSRLKRYRQSFDGAVPHFSQIINNAGQSRWPWVAAGLFIASGAMASLAETGLRNDLLAIPQQVVAALSTFSMDPNSSESSADGLNSPVAKENAGQTSNGLLPLPGPSAGGEIVLADAGPYDVASIASPADTLTIRGVSGVRPIIRVGREPLRLAARSVQLINVAVESSDEDDSLPPSALLLVRSDGLSVQDCTFHEPPAQRAECPVIAWTPLSEGFSEGSRTARQIEIRNTLWRGDGQAIWCAEAPSVVRLSNCLKIGNGPCFEISKKAALCRLAIELNRVTLRNSGPLLCMAGAFAEDPDAPAIEMIVHDCVFHVSAGAHGLTEAHTKQPRSNLKLAVQMRGHGSIVSESTPMMVTASSFAAHETVPVDDADEQFEGLASSQMQFAGSADGPIRHSQLTSMTAPRTAELPGVDAKKLPSLPPR